MICACFHAIVGLIRMQTFAMSSSLLVDSLVLIYDDKDLSEFCCDKKNFMSLNFHFSSRHFSTIKDKSMLQITVLSTMHAVLKRAMHAEK